MVLQFSSNLQARDSPSSHEFRAVFLLWSLLFTQLYGMCPRDGLLCNSVIYRSQSKETEPPTLSMSNKPFTLPEPRLMTSSYWLSPVPNPGASQVALVVKNLPVSAGDLKDAGSILRLGMGMATHSSALAWTTPWTEEPGGLQSVGLQRVRHD